MLILEVIMREASKLWFLFVLLQRSTTFICGWLSSFNYFCQPLNQNFWLGFVKYVNLVDQCKFCQYISGQIQAIFLLYFMSMWIFFHWWLCLKFGWASLHNLICWHSSKPFSPNLLIDVGMHWGRGIFSLMWIIFYQFVRFLHFLSK